MKKENIMIYVILICTIAYKYLFICMLNVITRTTDNAKNTYQFYF